MKGRLDDVRVVQHCPMSWNSMSGDDRVRECERCQRFVYDISNLTRQDAENLIREYEGPSCGRYFQRRDGTIVTRDCGKVAWTRYRWMAGIAGILAVGVIAAPTFTQGKPASPRVDAIDMISQNKAIVEALKVEKDPVARAELERLHEKGRRRFAENLEEVK